MGGAVRAVPPLELLMEVKDMAISQELLEILVCPECKGDLEYVQEGEKEWLVCNACKLKYPIREGIPVMLPSEAEKME